MLAVQGCRPQPGRAVQKPLTPEDSTRDFGQEAIATLLRMMKNHR
jgi:hypothetical protein